MLCGNSGFEPLQAAPSPKQKCNPHCWRNCFLVRWSGKVERQKNPSDTVFPFYFKYFFLNFLVTLPFSSSSSDIAIMLSQQNGGEMWFRWLILPILYNRDIFTLCSEAITVPLQCIIFFFIYSASLTKPP